MPKGTKRKGQDVYRMDEIAELLGMGVRQTYRHAKAGQLSFVVKVGSTYIAPKLAYKQWLRTAGGQL